MSCWTSYLPGFPGSVVGVSAERFSPYAVETRTGPHVTIQAGVVHAGRFWTTTSRDSLKARSVRSHGVATAIVRGDREGQRRIVAGPTIALDPTRPLNTLTHPFSSLFAPGAVVRLLSEQVAQIVGYVESANRIPAGWLPHHRVLLVTNIDRSVTVDGTSVVAVSGAWDRAASPLLGEPTDTEPLPAAMLDPSFRSLLDGSHPVHLGVATPDGPVALPATWSGDGAVRVAAEVLGIIRAQLPGPASLVIDDSSSRRPDRKRGAMFRGHATIRSIDGPTAEVAFRTRRITTWDGFEASTTDLADASAMHPS